MTLLLRTKLRLPITAFVLPRLRLNRQLERSLQFPLTLIAAPAGFGKTSLVTDWLRERPSVHSAWLSLDEGDNNLAQFFSYVVAALDAGCPGVAEELLPVLDAPQLPAVRPLLTVLINALSNQPEQIVLVLDDYHLITDVAIHEALTFLIDHLPTTVHIFLTTRSDPPLPLARWRVRQQLFELRADDLRFTADEIALVAEKLIGYQLTTLQLSKLKMYSEGWIVALQLFALAANEQRDVDTLIESIGKGHRYVLDYLVDEVLKQQPTHMQQFLIMTSPLDRLCGSLCAAVTAQSDADSILELASRTNLFLVSLDSDQSGQRLWYRYHRLFADMLRGQLRRYGTATEAELHERAAVWFAQNDYPREAIQHYLAAGNAPAAAALVETLVEPLLQQGQVAVLRTLLHALPTEVQRDSVQLCLANGLIAVLSQQTVPLAQSIRDAEQALEAATAAQLSDEPRHAVNAQLSFLRAVLALSNTDLENALRYCEETLLLLDQRNEQFDLLRGLVLITVATAWRLSGDPTRALKSYWEVAERGEQAHSPFIAVVGLANTSTMLFETGDLQNAYALGRRALRLSVRSSYDNLPISCGAYLSVAMLEYEWNRLDEADEHIAAALDSAELGGLNNISVQALGIMARIQIARGNYQEAEALLYRARQLASQMLPGWIGYLGAMESRLQITANRLWQAVQWRQENAVLIDTPYQPWLGYEYGTLIRILIAEQRYQDAATLIERVYAAAITAQQRERQIEMLTLKAIISWLEGQRTAAVNVFLQAIDLAEPQRYIRTILDCGTTVGDLLRAVKTDTLKVDYVSVLLNTFNPIAPSPAPSPNHSAHPLSMRELDVLRLIAEGASNSEVASELYLSIGTVKKHLNNIFAKLDATSRTQAVARARDLSLV